MSLNNNRFLLGVAAGSLAMSCSDARAAVTAALIEPASTRTFTTSATDVVDVYDTFGRTVSIGPDSVATLESSADQSGVLIVNIERGSVIATRAATAGGSIRLLAADGQIDLAERTRLGVEVPAPGDFTAALVFGRAEVTAGAAALVLDVAGRGVRFEGGSLSDPGRVEPIRLSAQSAVPTDVFVPSGGDSSEGSASRQSAESVQTDERAPGDVDSGFVTGGVGVVDRPAAYFGDIVTTRITTSATGENGNGTRRLQAQNRMITLDGLNVTDFGRTPGSTTSAIYNAGSTFTQVVGTDATLRPQRVDDFGAQDMGYAFLTAFNDARGLFIAFDSLAGIRDHGQEPPITQVVPYAGDTPDPLDDEFTAIAPIIVPIGAQFSFNSQLPESGLELPQNGGVTEGVIATRFDDVDQNAPLLQTSIYGNTRYRLVASGFACVRAELCRRDYVDPDPGGDETPAGNAFFVERSTDNFLALEGRPDSNTTNERFLMAAGDIDGTYTPRFSVDRFYVTPGLEGYGGVGSEFSGTAPAIRAFLRSETALGLPPLSDSGVLIVNPASDRTVDATQTGLLHVDFGFAETASGQLSAISLTTGHVDFSQLSENGAQRTFATVTGATVGSSRLDERTSAVAIVSPLFSTSVGGGNPNLRVAAGGAVRTGTPGYMVLENFNPLSPSTTGGIERGTTSDTRYALLRLATATGSSPDGSLTLGSRTARMQNGWLAGFTEVVVQGTVALAHFTSGDSPAGLALGTDPLSSRASASLNLRSAERELPINLGGGVNGTGVLIDDRRFGMRTPSGPVSAMVSAGLIDPARFPELPGGMRIPDYQYLKWGFFFGDVPGATGTTEHAHLVPWVAGVAATASDVPTSGAATFVGHVVANVTDGDTLRTEFGSFTNRWNFAARSGDVQMAFDGAAYTGTTALRAGGAIFDGEIASVPAAGGVSERRGELIGNFTPGPDRVQAVSGRFSVRGDALSSYRAVGTFAGEDAVGP